MLSLGTKPTWSGLGKEHVFAYMPQRSGDVPPTRQKCEFVFTQDNRVHVPCRDVIDLFPELLYPFEKFWCLNPTKL